MKRLEEEIREFLTELGAIKVGFATLDSLAGGPASSDLTYVLPETRSAVSFALPLDLDEIRATLAKKSHKGGIEKWPYVDPEYPTGLPRLISGMEKSS